MNCELFSSITSWSCAPVGRNSLQVYAPLTLGQDGQHVSFYVMEDVPGRFYLTDAHSTIQHAIDQGARPSLPRLQKIAKTPGAHFARIALDGEITAEGSQSELKLALWDALRLAMAISDNEVNWLPKSRQERFATQVAKSLKAVLPPGSVVTKPKMTGSSGHQIEFPFGVRLPNGVVRAIQPIGTSDDHKVDWGYVYQSFGKLSDLKRASPKNADNRVVVMETGASQEEFGRAATVLSESARVILFADTKDFANQLMAA